MTVAEFQAHRSGELKVFFDSPLGKEFLTVLNGLRPQWESPNEQHLLLANSQQIRGYETCLRNIVALMMPPKVVSQPEANYGVPDRKPTDK